MTPQFTKIKIVMFSMIFFLITFAKSEVFAQGTPKKDNSEKTVADILAGPKNRPRADTYYLVALAYANKGNIKEAQKTINTGLKIEPRNTKLLNLQAAIFARKGQVEAAANLFRAVLRLDPENEYARNSLNMLQAIKPISPPKVNSKTAPPSIPQKPIEIKNEEPKSESTQLDLGYFKQIEEKQRCYFIMANVKRAQDALEARDPSSKGKFEPQRLIAEKLVLAPPVCPKGGEYSLSDKGFICSRHGSYDALESEVKAVFSDFNKGMKAKFERNYPEAKAAFMRVTTIYPKWSEAFYQLGDTCFRMGADKEAIQAIRTCLQLEPKNLDAQLLLANLYFKTGQKDASIKILDSVHKNWPNTIHAISARKLKAAIESGKNYYAIFPPE